MIATAIHAIVVFLPNFGRTEAKNLHLSAVCMSTQCYLRYVFRQYMASPCRWIVLKHNNESPFGNPLKCLLVVGFLWKWRLTIVLCTCNNNAIVASFNGYVVVF